MIRPPFLKTGDKICIVAPARKVSEGNVTDAIETFESWGLYVELGKSLFDDTHSYLSSTDSKRLEDFQNALDDSSIKAIFCARGGYGSARILDQVNFDAFCKNPKWIIGFSDITALHLQLQKLNIQSVHGIMPLLFNKKEADSSIKSLQNTLFGTPSNILFDYNKNNLLGNVTSELIGGNLSLIIDSIGTRSEIDTENKILIVEEIDEYLYKIDRMMVQLKRAGKFEKLSGLIVGHITDIKDTDLKFGESLHEIINSHVAEYNIPVAYNFPSGHENPNLAWIEGAKAMLTVSQQGSQLIFL